jgi:hypothetical protein
MGQTAIRCTDRKLPGSLPEPRLTGMDDYDDHEEDAEDEEEQDVPQVIQVRQGNMARQQQAQIQPRTQP